MTEQQWLTHGHPTSRVHFLEGKTSDRKLRLHACACARWTWSGPPDVRCMIAVETAERFADGQATIEELAETYRPARRVSIEWARQHPGTPGQYPLIAPADAASRSAFDAAHTGSLDAGWKEAEFNPASADYAALADLARCVFGNPFRPAALDPDWSSAAVVSLAREIYDSRAFGLLPTLADSLVAAGCNDADIQFHCRTDRLHARGCWVVDLLGRQ